MPAPRGRPVLPVAGGTGRRPAEGGGVADGRRPSSRFRDSGPGRFGSPALSGLADAFLGPGQGIADGLVRAVRQFDRASRGLCGRRGCLHDGPRSLTAPCACGTNCEHCPETTG
ncbi:hypothetical protein MGSAQ_002706 [marine sediment metagenome]|uniref:Uncharacterized protein n=1 Tax=marine sediment metagenome TaxID=412755 RepID=A0A1B6NR64_9ZZZZ